MNKILLAISAVLLTGCVTSSRHYVIAATGTVVGLEVAQNPATQMYQAKLGYNRAELAVIPSNRASGDKGDKTVGGGAADTTDVVMELNYANIFSLNRSGIYQRLAVGKTAVAQPGAVLMFAKDKDGTLDPKVAESIAKATGTIPQTDSSITAQKLPLAKAYAAKSNADDDTRFQAAAAAGGYSSFEAFLLDTATTQAQLDAVKAALK